MAHGTPLATGGAYGECGAAGPYFLDVGISSSYHIAKFFDLIAEDYDPNSTADRRSRAADGNQLRKGAPVADDSHNGASLDKIPSRNSKPGRGGMSPDKGRINVGAIITKALQAAGLMKQK
jgi:hypothetical protein